MFMGSYENSIDAKARMIVPSKFREELGLECVMTRGFDTCLDIYPMSAWKEFEEKLRGLPMSNPNARNFARKFRANAVKCEIDKQGRIMLPQYLRDYACLGKDVVIIGAVNRAEIWDTDVWDAQLGSNGEYYANIEEDMKELGI